MQVIHSSFGLKSVFATLALATVSMTSFAQHYQETKLVSDLGGASHQDANLVNPWGLSRSSGSPWWVADNGTGLSTLYDGTGSPVPLVVKIPAAKGSTHPGNPTGTVFNGGGGFEVAPGKSALFLFVTEDGTISGWNPTANPTVAIRKVNRGPGSVFKGATMATAEFEPNDPDPYLYVADFRQARVLVYDSHYHRVPISEERFHDPALPAGYAPFNIQNIGGELYVAYAAQDSAKHDEVDAAGLGYVDIFSPTGRLLRRLQHGPWFNAPWGLTLASGDFGVYTHDLLVGQFGSGDILVFDPVTGRFLGRLRNAKGQAIHHPGLWALSFGNGGKAGPANTLYFSAGTNHEQDGLLGSITAIENPQGNDQ